MNKERRKAIGDVRTKLEECKGRLEDRLNEVQAEFAAHFEEIKGEIETLKDEEQDYYDNMPESFQNGDKGSIAQTAIDALDEAANDLDGFDIDASQIVGDLNLDDVLSKLDDASA